MNLSSVNRLIRELCENNLIVGGYLIIQSGFEKDTEYTSLGFSENNCTNK